MFIDATRDVIFGKLLCVAAQGQSYRLVDKGLWVTEIIYNDLEASEKSAQCGHFNYAATFL
jgi:hypothetical protein